MKTHCEWYYRCAFWGFLGLFALLMLWHTVLFKSPHLPTALLLLLTIGPLLLPMRGFLAKNAKSCAWMGYVSLPYFIHGITEVYANALARPYAALEIFFSLMLFLGTALFVRFVSKTPHYEH